MNANCYLQRRICRGIFFVAALGVAFDPVRARTDDTDAFKAMLQRSDGGTLQLQAGRVYRISEKIELVSLCPRGVTIEGNDATIEALPGFRHNVLLTATTLLRDEPYAPGVALRNLTLDGRGHVGRCLFGNWKNARLDHVRMQGGTIYQVNAIWHHSMLSNLQVMGNPLQTNNGFDCNLQNSTIWNIEVNMRGNLKESGLWLNGSQNATVIRPTLTDGRSAFGLENCSHVYVINPRIRGDFSFRVMNILPADASEHIYLYDVDLDTRHIGRDASAGIHFHATKGGLVVRGRIRTEGPGILLTHGASDIDVIRVDLPRNPVHPVAEWVRLRNKNVWLSKRRLAAAGMVNRAPVVCAGPDLIIREPKEDLMLRGVVADEDELQKLSVNWQQVAGAGRVAFTDSQNPDTRVKFPKPGTYKLLLRAHDGELQNEDEVVVRVGDAG